MTASIHRFVWSDATIAERSTYIKPYVKAGYSASKIADFVSESAGGIFISRNVIIGHCNRNGLRLRGPNRASNLGKRKIAWANLGVHVQVVVLQSVVLKARTIAKMCAYLRRDYIGIGQDNILTLCETHGVRHGSITENRGGSRVVADLSIVSKRPAAVHTIFSVRPLEGSVPISFDDLTRQHCRWPVGEASGTGQLFCGVAKTGEKPYCTDHHKLSVVPTQPKPIKVRRAG